MGDIPPDFVRELWLKVRPHAVDQADRARRAAAAWSADGDRAAWEDPGRRAHQLAGSLGSFGQRDAATAAQELDVLLHMPSPDPVAVVEAATILCSEVERT